MQNSAQSLALPAGSLKDSMGDKSPKEVSMSLKQKRKLTWSQVGSEGKNTQLPLTCPFAGFGFASHLLQ